MPKKRARSQKRPENPTGTLRIIGGRMRGRPIQYTGDPRTRPMKQRVREAAFNLIGPRVVGAHVVDLFAGTGALTWEALSRGAQSATLIERHFPTAKIIRENARSLGLSEKIELVPGDTFVWSKRLAPTILENAGSRVWLVFCSPPYELYVTAAPTMLELVDAVAKSAPPGSLILVEADERFAIDSLPAGLGWDKRRYPPAVLAIGEVEHGPVNQLDSH